MNMNVKSAIIPELGIIADLRLNDSLSVSPGFGTLVEVIQTKTQSRLAVEQLSS